MGRSSATDLESGSSYYITASGIDDADDNGNAEPFYVKGSTFSVDFSSPITSITSPVHTATHSVLAFVSGASADEPSAGNTINVGMDEVQLMIQRQDGDASPNWNGGSWQAGQTWISTAPAWLYSSMPSWEHSVTYLMAARIQV